MERELIIIGGGPAGLTSAVYACRGGLNAVLIEKSSVGGLIIKTDLVENYPGFPEGISGFDLAQLMEKQAARYGLEIVQGEVFEFKIDGQYKIVTTPQGEYRAKAVIIASGSELMRLNVPGEKEFMGRGVSYCATCDGPFFRGSKLVVVGGGDVAITEAIFLTQFADKVSIIHRRDQLRAGKLLQDRAMANDKIDFVWDSVVVAVEGKERVESVRLRNVKTGSEADLDASGVFVAIGFKPNTSYLQGILDLDGKGSVIVDAGGMMKTSLPGVFAAGDVRHNSVRQVAAAVGDGTVAALSVERFIRGS
ncbi:MAG: thioredoxin-disulfide reductase [Dehalococcoidia bacterium]|nr:thioredoxin-disulfide reductase [Dehalococcoidia bacterium]